MSFGSKPWTVLPNGWVQMEITAKMREWAERRRLRVENALQSKGEPNYKSALATYGRQATLNAAYIAEAMFWTVNQFFHESKDLKWDFEFEGCKVDVKSTINPFKVTKAHTRYLLNEDFKQSGPNVYVFTQINPPATVGTYHGWVMKKDFTQLAKLFGPGERACNGGVVKAPTWEIGLAKLRDPLELWNYFDLGAG